MTYSVERDKAGKQPFIVFEQDFDQCAADYGNQLVNLSTYQDALSFWSTSGASVSANSDIAPDGSLTADTVTDGTVGITTNIYQSYSVATGADSYTASFYVKKDVGYANSSAILIDFLGTVESATFRFMVADGSTRVTSSTSTATISVSSIGDYYYVSCRASTTDITGTGIQVSLCPAFGTDLNTDTGDAVGSITAWRGQYFKLNAHGCYALGSEKCYKTRETCQATSAYDNSGIFTLKCCTSIDSTSLIKSGENTAWQRAWQARRFERVCSRHPAS